MALARRFARATLALALTLGCFAAPRSASAQCASTCGTIVPGGLVLGQTWTLAGSPYCVTGDIDVSVLTIEPGVCVLIDGPYTIDVLSTIVADGQPDGQIHFLPKDPATPWKGMRFTNTPAGSILRHCVFKGTDNSALQLTNVQTAPVIDWCLFEDNESKTLAGGAVNASIASGDLTLTDCAFISNSSVSNGGAVDANLGTGTLRIERCRFVDNTARLASTTCAILGNYRGGALNLIGNSVMENCFFQGNRVFAAAGNFQTRDARGGAVHAQAGDVTLLNSTMINNSASAACGSQSTTLAYGGGISKDGTGLLTLRGCLIGGNTLSSGNSNRGAGVYTASAASIENCTIARNTAHGLYIGGGTTNVRSSVLWGNNNGGSQVSGAPTITYSDVQQAAGTYPGMGNINLHPVFAGPGTEACELEIVFGSPCIDMGDPDPMYDDCKLPSTTSLGGVRNDMGAHGGPLACTWCAPGVPEVYCTSLPNSTGMTAEISWSGSTSVAANDLVLHASKCPPFQPGFFYYGCLAANAPLFDGVRCVGGTVNRILPVVFTDGHGGASQALDYTTLPLNGLIAPGDYVNFQFWFRDPAAMMGGSNLSDALRVPFCP